MSLDNATKELQAALAKLREGHALITAQIATLESFLASMGQLPKRRGRPPKALQQGREQPQQPKRGRPRKNAGPAVITTKGGVKRKKPNWSPDAREAARKRMQEYWAQRRKQNKG